MGSSFIVITASGFATWSCVHGGRRGEGRRRRRRRGKVRVSWHGQTEGKQDCSKHSAWGFAESLKKGGRCLAHYVHVMYIFTNEGG